MDRKFPLIMGLFLGMMFTASCSLDPFVLTPEANMANPASVHCEQNQGAVVMRRNETGGTVGICVFADGSECDEWAFLRGECQPGSSHSSQESPVQSIATEPVEVTEIAPDGCRLYINGTLGYRFHYLPGASVIHNDDPLNSSTIAGPVVAGESWPQITISHPLDREDNRLPEDVNLGQWLVDHNLLMDTRMRDVQIAGETAIHLRFDGSPQSYAYDRYYFAREGLLYMIVIGHTGNHEDWALYNHFLESFQFDE